MDLSLGFSSSSPSSPKIKERDLLEILSFLNYENSGLDVNLSLRPPNDPIRVCSICGVTQTPQWRNGPCGKKSACNACGLKYKKKMDKLVLDLALGL